MSSQSAPLENLTNNLSATKSSKLRTIIGAAFSIVILCVALWFLHKELSGVQPAELLSKIQSIPLINLVMAILFAILSYVILTGYDALAMYYIGRKVPYRTTALTSFMAYAVGHNVGFAALSGGSIRYRMYSLLGLSATEIAQIIVFGTATFALGGSFLLGLAMIILPSSETALLNLSSLQLYSLSVILLLMPILYLVGSVSFRKPIIIKNWSLTLPKVKLSFAQVALSIIDISCATAVLYVLLAPELNISFINFLGIYLLALAAGIISSVPGGIGVFEAVILAALPEVDKTVLLGTIIVYRLIYYVIPLSIALFLFAYTELKANRKALKDPAEKALKSLSVIAPPAIAIAVFLAGVVLLVSGSMPAVDTRLNFIARGIPLPIIELSHLAGSIMGVSLLILARGLYRRLHGAYLATVILLFGGMLASLLKGFDYEEAIILVSIFCILWISRDEFYRQGSVASQRFSPGWVASIIVVLCIVVWVALINYRYVEYSDNLWWEFAFNADAPRSLRAALLAAVTALAFSIWKILRFKVKNNSDITEDDVERIRNVIKTANDPEANVALLGDKKILWSTSQEAFIMYQVSGNSWIALGDPVGPESAHEELVWAFREMVDRHDGRTVFYQVSDHSLALYVDCGLAVAKLGEDARASLVGFSLEGGHRADFRQAVNKAKKQGASFEIVKSSEVKSIVQELRDISDSWLKDKAAAEKGFSIGSFSEDYICNFDCAIVRVNGAIVAFANLWPAPGGQELSVDLMRYNQAAPKSIMDYLFAELMFWGSANGYHWFSLGMAPLSGLEQRALAPLWHKMGNLIFKHGESFYNFEGLRKYKEKFDPQWKPKYIACPNGVLSLPRSLLDVARLISGGITKLVRK